MIAAANQIGAKTAALYTHGFTAKKAVIGIGVPMKFCDESRSHPAKVCGFFVRAPVFGGSTSERKLDRFSQGFPGTPTRRAAAPLAWVGSFSNLKFLDSSMPKSFPAAPAKGAPAVSTHTLWDALGVLESCMGVMNARMELLDDGVSDAARTLLKIAHTSLKVAIDDDTLDLQEDASRCLYEADAVLNFTAREADDAATWGALTLLELVRTMVNAAVETAMGEEKAATHVL